MIRFFIGLFTLKEMMLNRFCPKIILDTLFDYNPLVDVFYIHPTSYHSGDNWNASLEDSVVNVSRTDYLLQNQASVFAGLARLYAPYYRQMHIDSYTDLSNGYPAFHLAYSDVRHAFLQYWKYWNKGRPFIIAGHSQGTNHAERLLKEVILVDEKMSYQLKLAYLLGMPITTISDRFLACEDESQVDCFVSWRSYRSGFYPSKSFGDSIVSVNPIHWKSTNVQSDYTKPSRDIISFWKIEVSTLFIGQKSPRNALGRTP